MSSTALLTRQHDHATVHSHDAHAHLSHTETIRVSQPWVRRHPPAGPQLDGEGDELGVLLDERAQLLVVGVLRRVLLQVQRHARAPRQLLCIRVLPDLRGSSLWYVPFCSIGRVYCSCAGTHSEGAHAC